MMCAINYIISSIIKRRKKRRFERNIEILKRKLEVRKILDCKYYDVCDKDNCIFNELRKEYENR